MCRKEGRYSAVVQEGEMKDVHKKDVMVQTVIGEHSGPVSVMSGIGHIMLDIGVNF
jgi:hypothetical protein